MNELTDSTLLSMTKKELVSYVKCVQQNLHSSEEQNRQQVINCEKLLKREYSRGLEEGIDRCIKAVSRKRCKFERVSYQQIAETLMGIKEQK